jgi:hypothetical protein
MLTTLLPGRGNDDARLPRPGIHELNSAGIWRFCARFMANVNPGEMRCITFRLR